MLGGKEDFRINALTGSYYNNFFYILSLFSIYEDSYENGAKLMQNQEEILKFFRMRIRAKESDSSV